MGASGYLARALEINVDEQPESFPAVLTAMQCLRSAADLQIQLKSLTTELTDVKRLERRED